MPSEAADALVALYPALLRFAAKQLRVRHLDHQLAEDLVQEAATSWFAAGAELRTMGEMNRWLRLNITGQLIDLVRRRTDALDQDPIPLDEVTEDLQDQPA